MNCQQAKKISIIDYLASQGYQPRSVKNGSFLYNSPLRDESTPSFSVESHMNIWYDFGIGEGGGVLDLVKKLHNTDIAGALKILQEPNLPINTSFSFKRQSAKSTFQIEQVVPIQHTVLLQYLTERKISQSIANNYVRQVHYTNKSGSFFALGFKNDKGGYELRNKHFKGGSSPKTITTIKGFSKAINIFEGFMDFLSALEYYDLIKPANTTIVLNSIANLTLVFDIVQNFKKVNLYLDNDNAGNKVVKTIKSKHENVENFAQSVYSDYKDFNDFLQLEKPNLRST